MNSDELLTCRWDNHRFHGQRPAPRKIQTTNVQEQCNVQEESIKLSSGKTRSIHTVRTKTENIFFFFLDNLSRKIEEENKREEVKIKVI